MARNTFDYPADFELVDQGRKLTPTWGQWLSLVQFTVSALRQSGPTADRPTSGLYVSRRYYDTTLNKPVYVSAVNPTVWRDASGAVA